MKRYLSVAVLLAAGVFWQAQTVTSRAQNEGVQSANGRQPVVVELFTSEGCSTCPPADTLLAQLDRIQPLGSAQVIALEEHVDYWDQQGWKDPFSSSFWTERQRDYSFTLHNGNPFTPEMVVDGTVGFVGSHAAMARDTILKSAAGPKTKVDLRQVSAEQNKSATFHVGIEKLVGATPKDSSDVILAVTESGLHSAVKAGENSGAELSHSAVVRELKVLGAIGKKGQDSFSSDPTVKLDAKWNVANLRAVVFVQEKKSRRILGAAEIHVTR